MHKIDKIMSLLKETHQNPKCELDFSSTFELLVAVILSAQCTDKRVNQVTAKLFFKYNTPQDFAHLDSETLERDIFSCGFYRNKAKNIIAASKILCKDFNNSVPKELADLMSLPGVGRKTANVIYSVGFGGQAIAVDTHVFRVSNRLGIVNAKNELETEKQLMSVIPKENWSEMHHLLIHHGRYVCKSQNPNCANCRLINFCNHSGLLKDGVINV